MIEIRAEEKKVYLLGLAEAGDAALLKSLGIEILILCHQGMVWPHVKEMGVVALNIEEDGTTPDWLIQSMADFARQHYNKKVIALADRHGGLCQAVVFLKYIIGDIPVPELDGIELAIPDALRDSIE